MLLQLPQSQPSLAGLHQLFEKVHFRSQTIHRLCFARFFQCTTPGLGRIRIRAIARAEKLQTRAFVVFFCETGQRNCTCDQTMFSVDAAYQSANSNCALRTAIGGSSTTLRSGVDRRDGLCNIGASPARDPPEALSSFVMLLE